MIKIKFTFTGKEMESSLELKDHTIKLRLNLLKWILKHNTRSIYYCYDVIWNSNKDNENSTPVRQLLGVGPLQLEPSKGK